MDLWILSLGGSLVVPDGVDVDFINDLHTLLTEYIDKALCRFVLVIGGGAPARIYQQAYRDMVKELHNDYGTKKQIDAQDRVGIVATLLNATLIREVFADLAEENIVTNPEDKKIIFEKPILVGAGWKPGFSTDFDAVLLAKRFGTKTIINLSNITKVHTADPRIDSNAKPIDTMTWNELIAMVGKEWSPGMHLPFDPIATKAAADAKLEVIVAEGRDLDNLRAILDGKEFYGTKISG